MSFMFNVSAKVVRISYTEYKKRRKFSFFMLHLHCFVCEFNYDLIFIDI